MCKAMIANYCPVLLLLICGRIFESTNLILKKNKLLSLNNLVFDQITLLKTIYYQLSATTMQILIKVLLIVRANFLDISKDFRF